MGSRTLLFRFALIATLILVFTPGVSGWTLQNWSVTPAVSELPPGTPVTADYSIHFDSWMEGSTFNKDNSLIMNTDLSNPQWVVGKAQHIVDRFFLMSKGHNIVDLQGYRPHFNALSVEHDERDQRRRTNRSHKTTC